MRDGMRNETRGRAKEGKTREREGREEWRDRSVPDSLWHPQQAGGKRGGGSTGTMSKEEMEEKGSTPTPP